MQLGIWIMILVYFCEIPVHGKSHYVITYKFEEYIHFDRAFLYNQKSIGGNFFKLHIHGYEGCLIKSNWFYLNSSLHSRDYSYTSNVSTSCDLREITWRVDVNHNGIFSEATFYHSIQDRHSSGTVVSYNKYFSQLRYEFSIWCSSHYYGDKCDEYCKANEKYRCLFDGTKICKTGYYGPQCDAVCRPSPKYRCDRFGKRICKKYYHGELCDKYCKRTDHYNCSKNGNKLCHSGYYGSQCDTVCRPSPKYRCDRLGKRICKKYYYGELCDKYCKATTHYRCDKNGDNRTIERNSLSLSNHPPQTSVAVIVPLVILCAGIIGLIIIKKKTINNLRQSTKVMIYQSRNSEGDDSSNNDYSGSSKISSTKRNLLTIHPSQSSNSINEVKYNNDEYMDDNGSIYEQSRFDHNNDDTCTIVTCVNEDSCSGNNIFLESTS